MMNFFKDRFFSKNFAFLFVLNSLYISLAQFYNLPKLFDGYWWYSFFYREAMLFCTYFMVFCLLYALPFQRLVRAFIVVIWSGIVDIIAIVLFALYFTGRIKSIKQNIHYSNFQNSSHP